VTELTEKMKGKCPCCCNELSDEDKIKPIPISRIPSGPVHVPGVYICPHCEALLGECTLTQSYFLVNPYLAGFEVPKERIRYFDLMVTATNGRLERRHGWYDTMSLYTVQTG
jgi:hypothetical protein